MTVVSQDVGTAASIVAFQKRHHLPVTAIVDDATKRAMNGPADPPSRPRSRRSPGQARRERAARKAYDILAEERRESRSVQTKTKKGVPDD